MLTSSWARVLDYVRLMKPRIIVLLLITTAGAMWLASQGQPDMDVLLTTLGTGTLAAGAANTMNCLYDRDIDRVMVRTQGRPIPAGRIQPVQALVFAVVLAVGALVLQKCGGVQIKTIANKIHAQGDKVPVTAAQPTNGGIAPAAPPITIFWELDRFNQWV